MAARGRSQRWLFHAGCLAVAAAVSLAETGEKGGQPGTLAGGDDTQGGGGAFADVSASELLRGVERQVARGFVPPFLARELYSGEQGGGAGSPQEPAIEAWGRETPKLRSEMRKDSRGEVVLSDVVWFATSRGREDFAFALRTYGISAAARPGGVDRLAALAADKADWDEALLPPGAEAPYGLRYAASRRAGADLELPPRLTNDAVSRLRAVNRAYDGGDPQGGHEIILSFFRDYGTHYLPGPLAFGGLVYAETVDPPEGGGASSGLARTVGADAAFKGLFARFGVHLRIDGGARMGHDPPQDEAEQLVGNLTHVAGGADPALSGPAWLRSVRWGTTPTSAWGLIDRGVPRPIWELVHRDRDPQLGALLVRRLHEAYVRLLRRANAEVLHNMAVAGGRPEVRFLVAGGLDVDAEDERGRTPLHVSVERGNMEAVRQLLQSGANPRAMDPWKEAPPLHVAAAMGHTELCETLLRGGADVRDRDAAGRSVGDVAMKGSNTDAFEALRRHAEAVDHEL